MNDERWDLGRFLNFFLCTNCQKNTPHTPFVESFGRFFVFFLLFFLRLLVFESKKSEALIQMNRYNTRNETINKKRRKKLWLYYYYSDESQISRRAFVDAFSQSNSRHKIVRKFFFLSSFVSLFLFLVSRLSLSNKLFQFWLETNGRNKIKEFLFYMPNTDEHRVPS